MHYICDCGKAIGLMANAKGDAVSFKCPHTNRVQSPQLPVKRDTKKLPRDYEDA